MLPVFDADEVKASFASDGKAAAPFVDPDSDEAGAIPLPSGLEATIASWQRPVDLVEDRGIPYVVEPTVDPSKPRALSNGLDESPAASFGVADSLVASVASAMALVADHADDIDSGYFLWENIWPKGPDGLLPALSTKGRYVVRVYDHGAWRAVTIDDRLPCDDGKRPLLPRSRAPLELWPQLLAKALFKVASRDASGILPGDVRLVAWLTGRCPQSLALLPVAHPKSLLFDAAEAAMKDGGAIVALVPSADAADRSAVEALGVPPGVLTSVMATRRVAAGSFFNLKCVRR